jgi:hypothetical protein
MDEGGAGNNWTRSGDHRRWAEEEERFLLRWSLVSLWRVGSGEARLTQGWPLSRSAPTAADPSPPLAWPRRRRHVSLPLPGGAQRMHAHGFCGSNEQTAKHLLYITHLAAQPSSPKTRNELLNNISLLRSKLFFTCIFAKLEGREEET